MIRRWCWRCLGARRHGEVLNDRSLDWRAAAHADRGGQLASNPELELSSIHIATGAGQIFLPHELRQATGKLGSV